jgi:NAD(P)-dependent dehydrogenase (short-subunit alcohol dehydrogenase family)
VEGDVADTQTAERALKTCLDNFGRIDILVNNAGMVIGGSILDLEVKDWERQMKVNLDGHMNFCKVVAREMVSRKTPGRIINMASTAADYYEVGLITYSATKGAIVSFTKGLAVDLAKHKILVNAISPGWVDTQMGTGNLKPGQLEIVERRIPLGRVAQPADIAGVAVFLASNLCTHMTGQSLLVDGGQTIDATIQGVQY